MNVASINFECDSCKMRCRLVIHYLPTSDNAIGYTCPEDIGGCGKYFEHDISPIKKELFSEQTSKKGDRSNCG